MSCLFVPQQLGSKTCPNSLEKPSPFGMSNTPSRAFAILKPNFVQYRLNIETEIAEAGFEIVKARQIHFNPEDESLEEVFGHDASSLRNGPTWVYVVDKENAIQDLVTLIGDEDPNIARMSSPNSIRAKFGETLEENVMYVAPDRDVVELLISAVFQSSPPFPPAAFPNEDEDVLRIDDLTLDEAPSSRVLSDSSNGNGSRSTERANQGRNSLFKARAVPPTTAAPSIQPRTTKAAALRAGLIVPSRATCKPRAPLTKEELARTFANVPGHKRSETIAVASTAPPTVTPRATRASLLRQGVDVRQSPKTRPSRPSTAGVSTTSDTPGYKRQLNIQVASTAPPAIQPRPTRASALRTGQAVSPPKKTVPRDPSDIAAEIFIGVPGHKRRESISVASTRPPATTPRLNRSATLRARRSLSVLGPPSSFTLKENTLPNDNVQATSTTSKALSSSSTLSVAQPQRPAVTRGRTSTRAPPSAYHAPKAYSTSPPPTTSRSSSVARPASIVRPPSIEPKTNRSAMLRARKMGIAIPQVLVA
ncbi:uncharacterized protein EI90DRAFT_3150888 [Cantharellus anzutake]|uniref:uncharacterized protein n=1 Tax=Cantharellus anzutake TaxID=1750568 RepID=UPI001903D053|nr:uncharacterized protein EI90DRAFT_3150888 [Cantharellus anzutake]KAF8340546.1 hypothetical protein EI90DRAFT_3150888 [Cantharellus anzutake]